MKNHQELVPHPISSPDPNGQLFCLNGELYRGICLPQSPLYETMIRDGTVDSLVDAGLLVESEIVDKTIPGFGIVLRHRKIEHLSFPYEWCDEMFRSAALLTLKLQLELLTRGLSLQDAHPWNVVFDHTRPVFVDICSIIPNNRETAWSAYPEFCSTLLYPLYLMASGYNRIARKIIEDGDGVMEHEVGAFLTHQYSVKGKRRGIIQRMSKILPSSMFSSVQCCQTKMLHKLIEEIEGLDLSKGSQSTYDKSSEPNISIDEQNCITAILERAKPRSVADIGCGKGRYTELLERRADSVVAFDMNEQSICHVFLRSRKKKLNILPLLMDFRRLSLHISVGGEVFFPPATRLSCEMVLVRDLIPELVFKYGMRLEYIVAGLAAFCQKHMVLEFAPRPDKHEKQYNAHRFGWYTLQNLERILRCSFTTVTLMGTYNQKTILYCEK